MSSYDPFKATSGDTEEQQPAPEPEQAPAPKAIKRDRLQRDMAEAGVRVTTSTSTGKAIIIAGTYQDTRLLDRVRKAIKRGEL